MMAIGGIVLAIVLALLGALARISRNPIAYGVSGFYVSFFRGTPLIVQMFLHLPGAAARSAATSSTGTPGCPTAFDDALILTPRRPACWRSGSTTAPT